MKSTFLLALVAGTLGATAELSWAGLLSEHVQMTALGAVLLLSSAWLRGRRSLRS